MICVILVFMSLMRCKENTKVNIQMQLSKEKIQTFRSLKNLLDSDFSEFGRVYNNLQTQSEKIALAEVHLKVMKISEAIKDIVFE